jgi:hypothetical protein
MMQKNEDTLLKFWFAYHAHLLGENNIYIFDNGSTDPSVLSALDQIELKGGNIIREHDQPEDFCNKGLVLLSHIDELRNAGYKIFIPMDCDEFLAIETPDGPSINSNDIREQLAQCAHHQAAQIALSYLNDPYQPNMFRRTPFKKVYGTFRGIDWLGEGFHHVRAPMAQSEICYFHYHYRPYREFRSKTAAKILAHGQGLSEEELLSYAESKLNGHQNAGEMLISREQYVESFDNPAYQKWPALTNWFRENLGSVPFESRLKDTPLDEELDDTQSSASRNSWS